MGAVKTLLTPQMIERLEDEAMVNDDPPGTTHPDCQCAPCRALRDAVANHKPQEATS